MSVGENIKNLRLKHNITQVELSDRLGITQSMLCQVERGTKVLTVPLGKQIAEILGCSFEELVADKG